MIHAGNGDSPNPTGLTTGRMIEAKKPPTNTVESFMKTLPKSSVNNSREIVAGAVAKALTMSPDRGNEMLKRRLGIDLDPDVIPGLDDGNGPKHDTYNR